MPMLMTNGTKVIAGGETMFKWVMQSNAARLNHEDQKSNIAALQRYFFKDMRSVTSVLVTRCYLLKMHPDQVKTGDAARAIVEKNLKIYETQLLVNLEKHLAT